MAVTKIRRISNWIFITVIIICVSMFCLFFLGPDAEPHMSGGQEFRNPLYTGEFMIWVYVIFGICLVSMLSFGIIQFAAKFITKPLSSILLLGVFASFGLLLFLTYTFGDATPIPLLATKPETQPYNTEFWLKITDMFIFSIIILLSLAILAIIWGSLLKYIRNR